MTDDLGDRLRRTSRQLSLMLGIGLTVLVGCTPHTAEESDDTRPLSRSTSIRVTKRFLTLAAGGDSAALATTAKDTVVRLVLLNHRAGAKEHLKDAVRTVHGVRVTPYNGGSEVTFRYTFSGIETQGYVTLVAEEGEAKVAWYGLMAKID
jgi:hypothetical protein